VFKQGGVALLRHNRVKKIVLVLACFGAFSSLELLVVDYVSNSSSFTTLNRQRKKRVFV
jgi:hypothetical protein